MGTWPLQVSAGSEKHDISYPWKEEHTDGVDSGTAYFEPSAGFALRGFKCLCSHCSDRHIGAMLNHLSIAPQAALIITNSWPDNAPVWINADDVG
jgi:hypothetical protein